MKHLHIYITTLFLLLLGTACTDEAYAPASGTQPGEGYRITVSIPAPMEAATRSIGDALTSDYVTDLPLFVLVFDENGFFTAFEKATVDSYNADTADTGQGTYTVDLPPSDGKCVLHFVLGLSEDDFATYTPDDSEASIFSRLTVGGNNDAYWQRVEVDHVIKTLSEDGETVTAISAPPLTDDGYIVKLVRNFAQVSVINRTNDGHFTLQGFTVLSEISKGTVAPYWGKDEDHLFADFDITGEPSGDAYASFTTHNSGYVGCNPPRGDGELLEDVPGEDGFTSPDASEYVYERNQDNAQNPAYVLLKAQYDNEPCYYKLDVVRFDEDSYITSYLNLYRNFHYTIRINKVSGKGYDTPQDAMDAAASNNISASVDISDVNKIEFGEGNSLEVSELDIMITEPGPHILDYDYKENGTSLNGKEYVQVTPVGGEDGGGYNHAAVQEIDWDNGKITITPADPLPALMETQEFIVAGRNGLARRVKVNVRQQFVFSAVDCDDVEKSIGAEMTLVVRLPENMPTSVFPLTLDIEPEKKSLYPDVSKNRIPVTSQGNYTFSYQATVTYNDYRQNRTFFFHFKSNMADSATRIVVTNPYFRNDDENEAIPEDEKSNVTSFTNQDKVYDFMDLALTGDNLRYNSGQDRYEFSVYHTAGEKVTLQFRLHDDSFVLPEGDEHIVEIFADYFDFSTATTETGTFTVREDGQCILYKPNDVTEMQYITFTVTRNLASETIQLSSLDHDTRTLAYYTPPLPVRLMYTYTYDGETTVSQVRNTTVSIYHDMDGDGEADNDELVTNKRTDNNGMIELESFAGLEETDVLIFQCSIYVQTGTNWFGRPTYEYLTFSQSISVGDLVGVDNPTLTLERTW